MVELTQGSSLTHGGMYRRKPAQTVEMPEENEQKRSIKRLQVLEELTKTEKDFLKDVNITIDDIMKPLLEHEVYKMTKLDHEGQLAAGSS